LHLVVAKPTHTSALVQMTYCGPLGEGSSSLIAWLSCVPGVNPIQPGANPATWMLVACTCQAAPSAGHSTMLLDERCLPAVLLPEQPLRRWLPSLQEVTGGSQVISAKASDVEFPTYYKVPCSATLAM
jgi:hypothetical protein